MLGCVGRWAGVALAAGLLFAAGYGCASDVETVDGEGLVVGMESAELGAPSNEARCATCHSLEDGETGFSGAPFGDIAFRSSYKGGDAPQLLEAANACVTGWMGGEPLEEADAKWEAMRGFLESISDPSITAPNPLMPEVLADLSAYEASYGSGGDVTRGEESYSLYCARCHDSGLVLGSEEAWPRSLVGNLSAGRIAQKVRTAGPPPSGTEEDMDTTPGPMPFFEPSELPADDLRDIIAYLRSGA